MGKYIPPDLQRNIQTTTLARNERMQNKTRLRNKQTKQTTSAHTSPTLKGGGRRDPGNNHNTTDD